MPPAAATLYVGGQNGTDGDGQLVADDLGGQALQAFRNLEACLAAAGAELHDVVKWTIFMDGGEEDVIPGLAAYQEVWGDRTEPPPAITVVQVPGFARPGVHCEIEAVAVVPGAP